MEARNNLKAQLKANYPFEPYQGQLDYSEQLYSLISEGGLGIFESPTGTVRIDKKGQKYGDDCGSIHLAVEQQNQLFSKVQENWFW